MEGMADVQPPHPVTAPASYKQPSRKGKKAWRKNVDISDVQTGLENVRDEVIKGGVLAERDADQLFVTDVTGDAEIAQQQKGGKLLRADEILAQRSAVAGLEGRKRKAAETAEPAVAGGRKRQKNGTYVSHRELQRLRDVAGGVNGGVTIDASTSYDPWAETAAAPDPRLDFLDAAQPVREPRSLREPPKSLAANGKPIPHVRKPDAGKSYNPLVGDWSALLEREGAAAVETETKRLAAEAAAAAARSRAEAEAAKVEAAEKHEYATDYDSAWESEWDGIQSGAEDEGFTQKPRPRKTAAERNKIKARKEREAREKWERKQRAREEQEQRIKQIAREASAKDKARILAGRTAHVPSDSSDDDTRDPRLRRRRFGQLPIPDAPLEVVLPDELEDSLRRLKPEGNLLVDRYRNMLVKGKVEMRKEQWQKKQAKKDRTEKWSYKDWRLK